jgi:enoyl-CoA hydratase
MEMTMSELVSYEPGDAVARITMDDGKVNALSIAMLKALHGAFDRAEEDAAVVVLTGREGFLSAGFDLKTFAGGDVEQVLEMLKLGATLCERMLSFERPVLVACNGHAVAAGSFLALSADVRIGVDGPFRLGLNEVQIGLTVPWFAIELARQRLAPAHFNQAVITARMYSPSEAVSAGLLDRVVAAEDLQGETENAAESLAALNSQAHAATKLRARRETIVALRSAIETELTLEGLGARTGPRVSPEGSG